MRNFYITGLPRSRTTWLALAFTAHGYFCWHEAMKNCFTKDEYRDKMKIMSVVGNSDCGLPFCDIAAELPGPTVIIERDLFEVKESLKTQGLRHDDEFLELLANKLSAVDGLRVWYHEIDARIDEIFMHCVGAKTSPAIMAMLNNVKAEPMTQVNTNNCWSIA